MNPAARIGILIFLLQLLVACSGSIDSEHNDSRGLSEAARHAGLEVGVAFSGEASAERKALVSAEFTSVTPENAMKWQSLSPNPGSYDFASADQLVQYAVANGQRIRGHALFWHRLNGTPDWVFEEIDNASDPSTRMRELMVDHIAIVVGRYAGQLSQWDVVNEPLSLVGEDFDPENIYYQLLGEEYIDLALLHAHAADPSAELFVNETFTEFLPGKFDALIALAQRLLDRGVPLHGLGLQGHFFLRAPDPVILHDQLERIADLGLKVEITELDMLLSLFSAAPDPIDAQAQAYADVFSACLSVPLCSGITVWGSDDAHTWLDSFVLSADNAPNKPLLFDASLRAKPAYDAAVEVLGNARL